jgi:hypothetical protein
VRDKAWRGKLADLWEFWMREIVFMIEKYTKNWISDNDKNFGVCVELVVIWLLILLVLG